MINPRSPWPRDWEEEWDYCVLCGGVATEVEVQFTTGEVEPQTDEVLTGATSGDTGVVVDVTLESGAWSGTAVGTIRMNTCTGIDAEGLWGQSGEELNGSVGGAGIVTLSDDGFSKVYGRPWPTSMLVERGGKLYCLEHYAYRFRNTDLDAVRLNLKDRGGI